MKAWRFYSLGDMRLDDVPYPEVKPGWAILKSRVVQPSVSETQRALNCTPKLLAWAVHLVATKRLQLAPLITHVLEGIDKVPQAFEITSNKSKYKATNPAQVVVSR